MDVRIQLSGSDTHAVVLELADWLVREDELRGRVSVPQADIPTGQMGGFAEVVMVTLGTGGAGAALLRSLNTWIRHRRPSIDIEISGPDGRQTRIKATDVPEEVSGLLRQVLDSDRHAD